MHVASTLRQGISLKWKKVPRLFQGTPALNTIIHPAMNQPVFVSLEHQVQGGKQTEIVNLNDYNMKLPLLGFLVTQLRETVNNPQMSGIANKENIKRWTDFIDELTTLVGDIRSVIGTLPSKNNIKFSFLISRLRKKLRDIKFLFEVIESTAKIKMPKTGNFFAAKINLIVTNLPQISDPVFKRSAVSKRFHGFKILFQGKMCSKRLCFESLNVTLNSIRSETAQAQNHSSIIVQGKALKSLQLGKFMSFKKAKKVLLKVPRGEGASSLTFNPTIHFMGIEKSVSCKIKEDTLSFNTSGLLYGRHEALVNVSTKTDVSDWSLLKYHVSGKMEKNSRLPKQLQREINTHIQDLAKKSIKRIENAESSAREAKQKFDSFQKALSEKQDALELSEGEKKQLLKARAMAKTEYEQEKVYVYEYYGEDVNMLPGCKLKQCEWECSTTTQCTYKTEKLKINVPQYKCEEKEQKVVKERIVQKSEIGYYWVKTWVLVDTGNCGQRNYERILGPIGGMLGTNIPIPVVGNVIGYFIGHVVGKIASALADSIFGCDQTYEMVPGPSISKTYTKIWNQRESYTVTEKVFSCASDNVLKVTENSYAPPKQTCTKDTCLKIMNAQCIIDNNACYNQTQLYRKNSAKSEYEQEKYRDFYEVNRLANRLEIATIDLYKAEAKYDKMLEETKLAKAQLKHLELAKNRTKAAILDVKAFPSTKLGLRLSKLREVSSNKQTVFVSDFVFDFTTTSIEQTKRQMPISITVKSIEGKKKELSSVFDFDKEEISLHKIVTKAVKELYEEKRGARRKRSIPEELYNKINKTGNQDGIQTLMNHDLCLEAKKASAFYKDIVKSLEDLVNAREQVELVSRNDIIKLTSVYKNFENITANGTQSGNGTEISQEITRSFLDYIASVIEDKQNFSMMSWNESLVSWRAFLEVLTKEESFLNCAGAQDCLIDIGEDLDELYLYESDFARANEIRMGLSNLTALLIDLISQNFTVEEIRYKTWDLHFLLNHTEDTNVLCGRKPSITFVSGRPQVVVENETLTLYCNANSDTTVIYQWIHNNESIIPSENGSLTIRKANASHAGSYKCKATNRKGFAISNVTIISVKSKPKITEHPNDTKVYVKDGKGLMLVCNATGDPEPNIEWFFISQYPKSSEVKIYNDNGTFLYYEKHTTNYSGYYYCIARNIYGQARSTKAKVWVLDLSPGEPTLGARINITKTCKSQRSLSWCGKVQERRDLPRLKKALIKSLNNPASNVENINFESNGLHTAMVSFLYASRKSATKEVISEPVLDPVVETFARKRKTLVNGLQTWYQRLKNDSSPIVTNSYEEIIGNAESLTAWISQPGCPRGQGPHSNGYMCYNCPPGTYGDADGQCTPCPIKTYQYEQGQTKCIRCPYGFTTKKEGASSPDECYDMRPSPPRNLQATAISSTVLRVKWLAPKENSKSISSYLIRYREATTRFKTERVPKTRTSRTLTRLKKFTDYHIVVYAVNSYGMRESKIIAKSGEDVPDAAPIIVRCIPVSYNNISVLWKPIPVDKRNGIIRGYHIYFKDVTEYQWQVYTTPTGNLTGTIVPGLRSYTEYCVKISVFTSKGEYPDWKRASCKRVKTPSRPVEVSGRALSPTEILLKFRKPGRSSQFNTFLVHYGKRQDRLDVTTACYSSSCVVRNLQEDTVYFFEVLEDVVQKGESAAILQIRTKKRGS